MSGVRTILVDGYNVIRNTPALAYCGARWWPGRWALGAAGATGHALSTSTVLSCGRRLRWREHGGEHAAFPGLAHGRVIFSRAGESADAVIVRMAAEARGAGHEVSVISDDARGARLARAGMARRRRAWATSRRQMEKTPRLIEKRFKDRLAEQRYLAGKDEDDDEPQRRDKGNPRRAPRKRNQRRQEPRI